jgi:hypothetical protein
VELKNVEQHLFIIRSWLFHVDPDNRREILQQLGQVRGRKILLNLRKTSLINKNLHPSPRHKNIQPQKGTKSTKKDLP